MVVVGAGPAGLWLASCLVSCGLAVRCIAPAPGARWINNLGLWLDELDEVGLGDLVTEVWPDARFVSRHGAVLPLGRTYARLDRVGLQERLLSTPGLTVQDGLVEGVAHDEAGSAVRLADGSVVRAALVMDASGAASRLVAREAGAAPGWQAAWGVLAHVEGGWPTRAMDLMDWTPAVDDEACLQVPSFLYTMPLADGRVFLEETSLVRSPAVPFDELRRRLEARLASRGVRVLAVDEVERCLIPMGGPLPSRGQRTVAFGAAAAMIHPATGYQVGVALRAGRRVATAVAEALRAGARGSSLALVAEEAVWSREQRRARELYRFGMDLVAGFGLERTSDFFETFFRGGGGDWRVYLAGDAPVAAVRGVMLRFFGRAPWSIRLQLASAGVRGAGRLGRAYV